MIHLQNKVRELQAELAAIEIQNHSGPDDEQMARSAGLVKFKENDESRYLGPSSGIAITRLVMELAKRNTNSESIKDIVPDVKARQIKERFTNESSKPTSKVYPLISDVAAPDLPSRGLTEILIDIFNGKGANPSLLFIIHCLKYVAQYMLPTLHEPSFREAVADVYDRRDEDPYKNFTLRMVIAISIQKYDPEYAGLADSYYIAALPFLEKSIEPMNLGTLQCFALIAQYSMVTPTRTASYWVVGLATRLCQELGLTEEATIAPADNRFNTLEVDMRRRLFWIITSMEYGLAHSLGRPSSFGTRPDYIDVGFFQTVDDCHITPEGVRPESPSCFKKLIAIHFFKMRLLQAEIRFMLYLNQKPAPTDDSHSWFIEMEAKLNKWKKSVPRNDEGSGLSEVWFEGRMNTMLVFLFRPSPQIPKPSVRAAQICYNASIYNISMQINQIETKSIDLTWIFTQSLFMALNTVLWALSYKEIRDDHPLHEVELYVGMAREGIALASKRWPGVESALELYQYLIEACLKGYENDHGPLSLPSNRPSPALSQDVTTPPPISSPSTVVSSISSSRTEHIASSTSPFNYAADYDYPARSPALSALPSSDSLQTLQSQPYQNTSLQPSLVSYSTPYSSRFFNPDSIFNPLPSTFPGMQQWSSSAETIAATSGAAGPYSVFDHDNYLGSIGDQYSQYLHAPYVSQDPIKSLSQEQQYALLQKIESTAQERFQ